jgi:hypothetical protein
MTSSDEWSCKVASNSMALRPMMTCAFFEKPICGIECGVEFVQGTYFVLLTVSPNVCSDKFAGPNIVVNRTETMKLSLAALLFGSLQHQASLVNGVSSSSLKLLSSTALSRGPNLTSTVNNIPSHFPPPF